MKVKNNLIETSSHHTENNFPGQTKIRVSIVCATGFGDALLQMIIANNLALQGFEVKFYSDFAYQLQTKINGYQAFEFPRVNFISELGTAHIVLYDCRSSMMNKWGPSELAWLADNAIAYRVSSGSVFDSTAALIKLARKPELEASTIALFNAFNSTMRKPSLGGVRQPLALQIAWHLKHHIGFPIVTTNNGIKLPLLKTSSNKIVIHPTSSSAHKNWHEHHYITLARLLVLDGFRVSFTVSPKEQSHWVALCDGEFDVPLFKTIDELANYYIDAAWFIGSDSGNAHFASCLGVPTLQIFRRWRKQPSWRAGWSKGRVITPRFPYSLFRKKWQNGVSVMSVYKTFMDWVIEEKPE